MASPVRTALITGASGGIGQALCKAFRAAGYHVIGTDIEHRSDVDVDQFIKADLNRLCQDEKQLENFCSTVDLKNSGLSVLINNAARQILGKTEELSSSDWYETLESNLIAPFLLTQAFLPALERASGSVINIGSVHATATKPGFVCYATSKAALAGLTRSLAIDLGPRVRVNGINPAAVATSMLMEGFRECPDKFEMLAGMHPLQRIAQPSEIADVAMYLASEKASFISGTSIDVDGGILSRLHDPE